MGESSSKPNPKSNKNNSISTNKSKKSTKEKKKLTLPSRSAKSSRKNSRITDQDRAILELKKQRDQLRIYQHKIDGEQEKLKELAKECLRNGDRDKAKLILKKKRHQESLLQKTERQIDQLEIMANTLEFTQLEISVAQGLKKGNKSLQVMHKLMSLAEVERIMEETQEGIEYQRELDEMLSGVPFTAADERQIMNELNELLGGVEIPEARITELPDVEREETTKAKKKPTKQTPKFMLAS